MMTPTPHPHRTPSAACPAPRRVALYVRDEHHPSSVDKQQQRLRAHLQQHHPDWSVVAVYQDTPGSRRKPPLQRPGLRDALTAASSGAYDVLLAQDTRRIGRRLEHVAQVAEQLESSCAVLMTADGTLGSSGPLTGLIMKIVCAISSYEREQAALERIANQPEHEGRRQRARSERTSGRATS
ncbi:recombinase family protein [Micromonospora aurantiaca (nom. illeg.)]|uniref:recombinase family protein n=1 Tax=Micromonospora aurantiaca (nom. illeg.) TaxID=47850 RepID=UPI003DA5909C